MAKGTIVVCGHGPGISDAVARKFGAEGYGVALVARSADRIAKAATELGARGINAKAFPCDLGNADAVRNLLREVRASMGPIAIVHWNAYAGGAGDLTTAPTKELVTVLDVAIHGLIAATQEALPDLKAAKGALLVTGGGLGLDDAKVNAMAVGWGAMGLAVSKAAQHKTVGLLHEKLKADGVYVGEVIVLSLVKGTPWDNGTATLEGSTVANRFWEILQARDVSSVTLSG